MSGFRRARAAVLCVVVVLAANVARAAEPITIGFAPHVVDAFRQVFKTSSQSPRFFLLHFFSPFEHATHTNPLPYGFFFLPATTAVRFRHH